MNISDPFQPNQKILVSDWFNERFGRRMIYIDSFSGYIPLKIINNS